MTRTVTCELSDRPITGFVAFLTYRVSHGWVDYVIEERDKLDSYEESDDTELGEGHGPTPEAAVADALGQVDAKLAARVTEIEAEIARMGADDFYRPAYVEGLAKDMRADQAIITAAVANLKGDWQRDNYHGMIKPMTKGETWAARFQMNVYADEDSDGFYDNREDPEGQAAIAALLTA